jgi:hypothetical protein
MKPEKNNKKRLSSKDFLAICGILQENGSKSEKSLSTSQFRRETLRIPIKSENRSE